MEKSVSKHKGEAITNMKKDNTIKNIDVIRSHCQENHTEYISKLSDETLIEIGKLVCGTDYAVRFYKNKSHLKFYKNRGLLEKAIRRSFAMGAFDHRETILDYLMELVWGVVFKMYH